MAAGRQEVGDRAGIPLGRGGRPRLRVLSEGAGSRASSSVWAVLLRLHRCHWIMGSGLHQDLPHRSAISQISPAYEAASLPDRSRKGTGTATGVVRHGATMMDIQIPLETDDLPAWAWDVVERHNLGLRADSPFTGANVLVHDAASDLSELSDRISREGGLTTETLRAVTASAAMLTDALKLASLCTEQLSVDAVKSPGG